MLESLITTYGYIAIFLGTFLEGETILVLGGFLAHRGYLALSGVMAAAFLGSLAGDQLFFYLGRRHSAWILSRRRSWRAKIERVHRLLHRYHTPVIVGFRFFYGLRTVTPFVIGMSPVPAGKFLALNALGAAVWAVLIGSGGFLFGHALQLILGNIKRYELAILSAMAAAGLLIWAGHFLRARAQRRSQA